MEWMPPKNASDINYLLETSVTPKGNVTIMRIDGSMEEMNWNLYCINRRNYWGTSKCELLQSIKFSKKVEKELETRQPLPVEHNINDSELYKKH